MPLHTLYDKMMPDYSRLEGHMSLQRIAESSPSMMQQLVCLLCYLTAIAVIDLLLAGGLLNFLLITHEKLRKEECLPRS